MKRFIILLVALAATLTADAASSASPPNILFLLSDDHSTPRPVYELYDLDAAPSELNNLSGKPELAAVERPLREALIEKIIRTPPSTPETGIQFS